MPEHLTIEQMKLVERDEVLAFLQKAYDENPRQSDERFWDWHFPESPYCDTNNLPIWIARVDGQIAGQLAAVPVEFNVAGAATPAIWILDLIVDPKFRRRGIAKQLALASKQFCPFVLGVNTSKQHSTELLTGLGWEIFTKIPRYQKLLFPGDAIREIAKIGPLRSIANLAFARRRRLRNTSDDVRALDGFDASFDRLWNEARRQWACSVTRSAAMLDWQFVRQPGKKFDILAYYSGGELRGYAVMFFRKPHDRGVIEKAAISDLCYGPDHADETVDALLRASVALAIKRRAGSLVTDIIDKRVESRLTQLGFWRVKSDLQLLANVPQDGDVIYDAANWYLTRGDSDISIFEASNL